MSMKKLLLTAASVNLALSLVACGPSPTDPTKASPSPTATPTATATPAPAVTATPVPAITPGPAGTPAPISTPVADPNADAQVTAATANKNADFSYNFSITGTGLGVLADYQFLQVKMGPSTVPLVVDGASKVNSVQLRTLDIAAAKIDFQWVPDQGAPTSGDEIEVTFERKNDPKGRRSSKVRLTVSNAL
jgi:hypothetical protein